MNIGETVMWDTDSARVAATLVGKERGLIFKVKKTIVGYKIDCVGIKIEEIDDRLWRGLRVGESFEMTGGMMEKIIDEELRRVETKAGITLERKWYNDKMMIWRVG